MRWLAGADDANRSRPDCSSESTDRRPHALKAHGAVEQLEHATSVSAGPIGPGSAHTSNPCSQARSPIASGASTPKWATDLFASQILAFSPGGEIELTLEVPGTPAGLGWDATERLHVVTADGRMQSHGAVGKRRRLRVSKPRPVHLDSAEQIAILLEAAGELDRGENILEVQDRHGRTWTQRPAIQTTGRRPAFATLLLGGGRASATGAMLWRDVDLANGRFDVGRDKTDAGMREVDMLPLLREILTEHKAASERTGPDDPVFVTSSGKARSRHNLRQDVVDAVVAHANGLVDERGLQPLPLGITPHKLRHTYASILVAIGKDPTYVMQQLGHTDPAFTLRVYSHMMRRSTDERERLKALVEGHVWAVNGQYARDSAPRAERTSDA